MSNMTKSNEVVDNSDQNDQKSVGSNDNPLDNVSDSMPEDPDNPIAFNMSMHEKKEAMRKTKSRIEKENLFKSIEDDFNRCPHPNDYTMKIFISACAEVIPPQWEKALEIARPILVDRQSLLYNSVMDASARAGQLKVTQALFDEVKTSVMQNSSVADSEDDASQRDRSYHYDRTYHNVFKAFYEASRGKWIIAPGRTAEIRNLSWNNRDPDCVSSRDLANLLLTENNPQQPPHILYHTLFEAAANKEASWRGLNSYIISVYGHWENYLRLLTEEEEPICLGEQLKNCQYLIRVLEKVDINDKDIKTYHQNLKTKEEEILANLADSMYEFLNTSRDEWKHWRKAYFNSNIKWYAYEVAEKAGKTDIMTEIKELVQPEPDTDNL